MVEVSPSLSLQPPPSSAPVEFSPSHHRSLDRYPSAMSAVSSVSNSPVHAEPLHDPSRAAQVVVPQAPLGNATNGKFMNQQPGMGAKALLAKKMAKGRYVGSVH